ncbi:ABC transporter substrate-binding protein [Nesterenkonia xinjiangensis]|uniref:Multiple sugar transport system substrate-binding protein n=1 Tax=Nesterenkonia xinjiangensis TaxID=225327 RepID=A0A7Z0GKY7_9MICC|nr:extracellular solute-binding protein [Nesterenkonia xinjiangensis]NYJ77862.1 multiple sugar transport system substrate-binding protein [Nesterenkonia xinjiangensis]
MKTTTHGLGVTIVAVTALLVAGCGNSEGEEGDVELRFLWWGSDTRHALTEEVIEAYEEENPGVSISAEYGGFDDHWDQLATQTAGGQAPDIIQMDEQYLREYADRGSLLELEGIDLTKHDEAAVENGKVDGQQFAVTMGINAQVLVADPQVFEEAGVELPDPMTWTWEDYASISAQITEQHEDAWGTSIPGGMGAFQTWMRQQGKSVATDAGELGFEASDASGYFQYFQALMDDGVLPPAELIQENAGSTMEQSLAATGQQAISTWWSNEAVALSAAADRDLEILRYPSFTGDAADAEPWYKSSMYLSASAGTDHPEQVQDFIDFFVNSESAAEIVGVERGIPPNQEMRELVAEDLSGMAAETLDYIDGIESDLGRPEPITPEGGSDFSSVLARYELEVIFGRLSPDEAGRSLVEEASAQLS